MKKINRTRWASLAAAGSLLIAQATTAQQTTEIDLTKKAPSPEPSPIETVYADSNAPVIAPTNSPAPDGEEKRWIRPQQIVLFGQNVELKAGDTAEEVVIIGGSAKIHGKVRDAVVVIGGTLEVDGEVGDAVVAVMGNVKIGPGAVIHRDAVAVMGNLTIAPGARVERDAVCVGGKSDIAEGAEVHGERVNVGGLLGWPRFEWLQDWFRYCLLEFRPLAPQVGWVWAVAGVFFLVYLFVAVAFPRPVQVCVNSLTQRPATTFCLGLLTKLLVPAVFLILAVTGIGLIVVPFLMAALVFGAIIGKVALLEWIGLRLGRPFGSGFQHPLLALLIGILPITLLYMIPIVGLLTYAIISVWGLGCAVIAVFGSMRRESSNGPTAPPRFSAPPPVEPVSPPPPSAATPPIYSGFAPVSPAPGSAEPAGPPGVPPQAPPPFQTITAVPPIMAPVRPSVLTSPKAGFWERMAAGFLDFVILSILTELTHGSLGFLRYFLNGPPLFFLVALAYFAGLWTWKGTTIGGIILKLQVVRSDGGPVTFVVALVRGLAAALSIVVFFLGFFWIAWSKDKQGWHDSIAGTDVIRVSRTLPLVCL